MRRRKLSSQPPSGPGPKASTGNRGVTRGADPLTHFGPDQRVAIPNPAAMSVPDLRTHFGLGPKVAVVTRDVMEARDQGTHIGPHLFPGVRQELQCLIQSMTQMPRQ